MRKGLGIDRLLMRGLAVDTRIVMRSIGLLVTSGLPGVFGCSDSLLVLLVTCDWAHLCFKI